MKKTSYDEIPERLLKQLPKGGFLTVKDKDARLNTMTIGWASIGYMWMKPVFMVMVRNTRYTFPLIENTDEFTVSFPLKGQLKKEMNICGTKSGRDIDKFKECNLKIETLENFNTPIISDCDLHILCKIIYKQALNPEHMLPEVETVYGDLKDYHTLYYGKIISILLNE